MGVLFIVVYDDGLGDLAYAMKFFAIFQQVLKIKQVYIVDYGSRLDLEHPMVHGLTNSTDVNISVIEKWRKLEKAEYFGEIGRILQLPFQLLDEDWFFVPMIHKWMESKQAVLFESRLKNQCFYVSDPSVSVREYVCRDGPHHCFAVLPIILSKGMGILLPKEKKQANIHTKASFVGFCYTHAVGVNDRLQSANSNIGLLYLFCLLRYAACHSSGGTIKLYMPLAIQEIPNCSTDEAATFLWDFLKSQQSSLKAVGFDLQRCELKVQKKEDFTSSTISSESKCIWKLVVVDSFPMNDQEFERLCSKSNVPFLGTAGINSLVDCLFKYQKIPICELYMHHDLFMDDLKYYLTRNLKEYLVLVKFLEAVRYFMEDKYEQTYELLKPCLALDLNQLLRVFQKNFNFERNFKKFYNKITKTREETRIEETKRLHTRIEETKRLHTRKEKTDTPYELTNLQVHNHGQCARCSTCGVLYKIFSNDQTSHLWLCSGCGKRELSARQR